ncbi:unnamed protein product [Pedinophyceae sp. YPF-701]|nr:unnamed protein product [Pedinophyceae sp. YPF-701]
MGNKASLPKLPVEVHPEHSRAACLYTLTKNGAETEIEADVEVSLQGIRILDRARNGAPVLTADWDRIPHWKTKQPHSFTVTVWSDARSECVSHELMVSDLAGFIAEVDRYIALLMSGRVAEQCPGDVYEACVQSCRKRDNDLDRVDDIKALLAQHRVTSGQAIGLLRLVADDFEKVTLAADVHARLVDQPGFGKLLTELGDKIVQDNVWARVKERRKDGRLHQKISSLRENTSKRLMAVPPA